MKQNLSLSSALAQRFHGHIEYLLAIIILLHIAYPISAHNNQWALVYLMIYCGLLALGVYVTAVNRWRLLLTGSSAGLIVFFGIFWVTDPSNVPISIGIYTVFTIFLCFIALSLLEFVFTAPRITRDVLLAATASYLLFGNIFTVFFMAVEWVTFATTGGQAFVVSSAPELQITWQHMIYYSYTTLTTLGYGDILPVTFVAQSFATIEAIIGVLYITVLLGRLVGLYAQSSTGDVL